MGPSSTGLREVKVFRPIQGDKDEEENGEAMLHSFKHNFAKGALNSNNYKNVNET